MTNKVLGGGIIDGALGVNPDFSEIEAGLGRVVQSIDENGTVFYWLVETTSKGGWLLANGLYANPTKVVGDSLPVIAGSFVDGFTLTKPNQVGIDSNGDEWKYIGDDSLPVVVAPNTDPSVGGDFKKLGKPSADDYLDLKVFQSPTNGGLTEIQTKTANGGDVYEVRKVSDDSLATIYSDAAGTVEIVQNGTSNVSDGDGVVEFYIADGDYYIEVASQRKNFTTIFKKLSFQSVSEVEGYSRLSGLIGETISTKEYHEGTGYGAASYDVVPSSSVTSNGIDIVQGVSDTSAAIVLRDPKGAYIEAFGIKRNEDGAGILERAATFGVLRLTPFTNYLTSPWQFYNNLIIYGNKSGFIPTVGGKLVSNVGPVSLTVLDMDSDLGGDYTTSADGLFDIDGADSFYMHRSKIVNGGRHVYCKNTNHVVWKGNRSEDSGDWGLYLEGDCSVFEISGNHAEGCKTHDGIKVGGVVEGSPVFIKNGVIINNKCRNNFRDGIDMAVNGCENLTISGNILANNSLKAIDLKILDAVALGQGDFKDVTISDNVIVMDNLNGTEGISIQNADTTRKFKDVNISGGTITGDTAKQSTGVKLENCSNIVVSDISMHSVFYGVRLIDAAQFNNIQGNTIHASRPFQLETIVSGLPSHNKIHNNTINQQGVGSDSNTARVLHGDNNQFWGNRIDKPVSSQYSLSAENLGTDATNTKWYDNNLGFVNSAPLGARVVIGDVFCDASYAEGSPDKWVAKEQTGSASLPDFYGQSQRGFKTNNGDPNGSVVTQFIGERIYDSSGGRFWQSWSTGNSNWV